MAIFPLPAGLTAETALTEIYASIWDLLESSAAGNAPGWRLPVLATLTDHGCEQRTVVLRVVDRDHGALLFHTDVRSSKVEQIRKDGRVSLLFYDHERSVQLKIRGVASIHQADEFAQSLWEAGTSASLKMYSAPLCPGLQCDSFDCIVKEINIQLRKQTLLKYACVYVYKGRTYTNTVVPFVLHGFARSHT